MEMTKQNAKPLDKQAVQELTEHAYQRLCKLVSRQLGGHPTVRKFENTGDVLHSVIVKILEKQIANPPETPLDYFREVSRCIRCHLIDELRKYVGRKKPGAEKDDKPMRNRAALFGGQEASAMATSHTYNPRKLEMWFDFHNAVEQLPKDQKDVVNLLFYCDLTQEQAAASLSTTRHKVSRLWKQARIVLADATPADEFGKQQ